MLGSGPEYEDQGVAASYGKGGGPGCVADPGNRVLRVIGLGA